MVKMRVLINGSSVSRGPGSWPYQIQSDFGSQPINLSQAAAGVNYIYETTIEELSQRKYDLVIVMWPPFDRWEYRVKNINAFSGTTYTSAFQRTMNDWPEKVIDTENDQDYVDPNWVFGAGYLFKAGGDLDKSKEQSTTDNLQDLFHGYFEHVDYHSQSISSLTKIIGLQSFINSIGIPYVFGWNRPFKRYTRFQYLYDQIDWTHFHDKDLLSIAKDLNDWDLDGIHPGLRAHAEYGQQMLLKINTLYPDCLGLR